MCALRIAGQKALADAGIPYSAIKQAVVGYVYGKKRCRAVAVRRAFPVLRDGNINQLK